MSPFASESPLFRSGSLSSSTGADSSPWLLCLPVVVVGVLVFIIVNSWSAISGQLAQAGGNAEVILVRAPEGLLKRSPDDKERDARVLPVELEVCSVDQCEPALRPSQPEIRMLVWPEGKLTRRLPKTP